MQILIINISLLFCLFSLHGQQNLDLNYYDSLYNVLKNDSLFSRVDIIHRKYLNKITKDIYVRAKPINDSSNKFIMIGKAVRFFPNGNLREEYIFNKESKCIEENHLVYRKDGTLLHRIIFLPDSNYCSFRQKRTYYMMTENIFMTSYDKFGHLVYTSEAKYHEKKARYVRHGINKVFYYKEDSSRFVIEKEYDMGKQKSKTSYIE